MLNYCGENISDCPVLEFIDRLLRGLIDCGKKNMLVVFLTLGYRVC